jgi:hypothetical protein
MSSASTRPKLCVSATVTAGNGIVCISDMRLASSIDIMGHCDIFFEEKK